MPKSVAPTSHPVLRRWILRQSCATTTAAIVIETSTASGAATFSGIKSASSGTANSASPNPNADRMNVARKTTSQHLQGRRIHQLIPTAALQTIG